MIEGTRDVRGGSCLLVHEDEGIYVRPIRSRMLIATVQRLDPGESGYVNQSNLWFARWK